jgi:hypothetical protein
MQSIGNTRYIPMPYKDANVKKLKHAEYSRKHYVSNIEENKARSAKLKRDKRIEWHKFKALFKCTNCGFSHPAAIDFHHVDRENHRSVNVLARNGNYRGAMEEIKKCIALCANCHRIHHYEERIKKKMRKKKKKKNNP